MAALDRLRPRAGERGGERLRPVGELLPCDPVPPGRDRERGDERQDRERDDDFDQRQAGLAGRAAPGKALRPDPGAWTDPPRAGARAAIGRSASSGRPMAALPVSGSSKHLTVVHLTYKVFPRSTNIALRPGPDRRAGRWRAAKTHVGRSRGNRAQRRIDVGTPAHPVYRRRSRRPLLRDAREEGRSRARRSRRRAQPPVRHLRLGRRVLRPDAGQPRGGRSPRRRDEIAGAFNHWDDIDVHFRGRTITSGGHGFCGIGRKRLLNILQRRCEALGVELRVRAPRWPTTRTRPARSAPTSSIARDGLNSRIRDEVRGDRSSPTSTCAAAASSGWARRSCSTRSRSPSTRRRTGWFQAHAYQYDGDTSTFIVETPEEVWQRAGLEAMSAGGGHRVLRAAVRAAGSTATRSCATPRTCAARRSGSAFRAWSAAPGCTGRGSTAQRVPVVLLGDAAHTAHFSIGSGTKLALEDAIALARAMRGAPATCRRALAPTRRERSVEVLKIQNAARNSTEWFENVERYTALEAEQFAYSLLTRSQRISHENLRLRDRGYVERRRVVVRAPRTGSRDDRARRRCSRRSRCAALTLAQPRRRVADGAVLVRRRHARRLLPRAPRQPRARRRRAGVHRDGLRLARRAHLAGLRGPVERRAARRRGSASSTTCTRARRRRSRCSSATPARRARRSAAGRTPTSRCRSRPDGARNWPLIAPSAVALRPERTRCRGR